MKEIKILHTADTHLRAAQYSRTSRGADFMAALERVVDMADKNNVDAILNSGDLLDTTRPTAETIRGLNRLNVRLVELGIPMFTISGNHDFTHPHWTEVLDLGYSDKGVICVDNKRFKVGHLTIQAYPYMPKEALLETLENTEPADILMWHGAVQEFAGIKLGDKAISISEFPTGKFKLIALGDIHVHRQLTLSDGTLVAMPGSTELCKENEELDKFVDLYTFKEGDISYEAIPLETRKVVRAELNTEDEVQEFLKELREIPEDKEPLVFVKYNRELGGVQARVFSVVDPKVCVVRCTPLPKTKQAKGESTTEDNLAPADFVSGFLDDDDLLSLATDLLQEDIHAVDRIDMFVEAYNEEVA
jgi:DNA repair protein SbcD/Mre11